MKIDVAFLPRELEGRELSGTVCIVIDIFRATTSMITAFVHGCRGIVPVGSIPEAWAAAEGINSKDCILAGERKGVKIEGFHLGNSPWEFTGEHVGNQYIVMTTTNGTAAIKATDGASATLIGAFLNANAVCARAKHYGDDILIICAGTAGNFSLEDALCAGLLVDILWEDKEVELTDAARAALLMYAEVADVVGKVAANSSHGRYLYAIGFGEDVKTCMRANTVKIVPEYRNGKIELVGG